MTARQKLIIDKSTGITVSIALLLSLVGFGFYVGSRVTSVEGQLARNTADINTILAKWDAQMSINKELNDNIIKLNARLDAIKTVSVLEPTPTPRVEVVSAPPTVVYVTPPQQEEEQQQSDSSISRLLQEAICAPTGLCL